MINREVENEEERQKQKEHLDKIITVLAIVGEEFLKDNIDFCLVGGVAVYLYKPKRLSQDLDFLIKSEDVNRALKILYKLFPDTPYGNFVKRRGEDIWHIDVKTVSGDIIRIDLIIPESEIEKKCLDDAIIVRKKGEKTGVFRVAKPDWLIELKRNAGRDKDKKDIDILRAFIRDKNIKNKIKDVRDDLKDLKEKDKDTI